MEEGGEKVQQEVRGGVGYVKKEETKETEGPGTESTKIANGRDFGMYITTCSLWHVHTCSSHKYKPNLTFLIN